MLISMNKVPFGVMVKCPNKFVHIVYVFPNGLDDVTQNRSCLRGGAKLQKTKNFLL